MNTAGRSIVILALGLALILTGCGQKNKEAVERVKILAGQWLTLIDEGLYGEAWDAGGQYFRQHVDKKDWNDILTKDRKPMGAVLNREIDEVKYKSNMYGAPDGEYILILFETDYEKHKTVKEEVTYVLEQDGQWRLVGYRTKSRFSLF